jgi:hypothetical protein
MGTDLQSVGAAVTTLEGNTTVADNHEEVCAKLEKLKETSDSQLTEEITRLRETLLERIASIPSPPSLEGCRNDDLEGPLKEYADMRVNSARTDMQREIAACASSLRTQLGDELTALREEMTEGLGPLKVLLTELMQRVESKEACCPCQKGELPAPMDALKIELEAKLSVMRRDVRVCSDKVLLARDSLLQFKHRVSNELRQMQEK